MYTFKTTRRIGRETAGRALLGTACCMTMFAVVHVGLGASNRAPEVADEQYRVLATSRTSTMEHELNEAAAEGFRFAAVMGGETAFGGSEVVVIVSRDQVSARFSYRLLATSKTSTMQRELQAAAADGFHYQAQTVFETRFGGDEVVVSLERNEREPSAAFEYQLLATSRTSTLERELETAASMGYELVGMAVGETSFGGDELVAITRRAITAPVD